MRPDKEPESKGSGLWAQSLRYLATTLRSIQACEGLAPRAWMS